jgi:hypothetical protein
LANSCREEGAGKSIDAMLERLEIKSSVGIRERLLTRLYRCVIREYP